MSFDPRRRALKPHPGHNISHYIKSYKYHTKLCKNKDTMCMERHSGPTRRAACAAAAGPFAPRPAAAASGSSSGPSAAAASRKPASRGSASPLDIYIHIYTYIYIYMILHRNSPRGRYRGESART